MLSVCLLNPLTLCMIVTQLATQIDFREKIIPIAF